jgi:hypothetical protein
METQETRQEALIDALWDAYNTLDELYRPLQIEKLKSKIDDALSIWGLEKNEEYENNWTDRAITALDNVEKMRREYLKTFTKK